MTESTQVKTPKKKVTKPKKPADHPAYSIMVKDAVTSLKERGGSSRQALLKYIMANYKVGDNPKATNARLKTALRNGVQSGILKQAKGTGAAGSFRLGEKKVEKKPVVKKPPSVKKAKKVKTPTKKASKKPAGEKKVSKPAAKKTKSPKKTAKPQKAKTPKKATKVVKPKKVKTPKKKVVKTKKA